MPKPTASSSHSLATSLEPFLGLRQAELTLGDMLGRIESGDGPGPVLFMLTLPVLLPLPPGVSMVLALPLLLVTPRSSSDGEKFGCQKTCRVARSNASL
ncbi:exopolysaccharide biosynthesis protein [Caulobacter sp. S45]|uniref:exopolysaccharide biosynthesis protein n=1 Tax=Caulobacter sp. S45 TaxID=1641861 RepID=UPI00131B0C90